MPCSMSALPAFEGCFELKRADWNLLVSSFRVDGCHCEFPFLVIGVYDYAFVGQNWSAGVLNVLVLPS